MRKLTLLLCALLAGISLAVAQTSISGTVLSAENDEPVIGASILVKGANASTITDTDGKFTIKIPAGASRTLVISYIGMEKQEVFARNGMVVKLNSADHTLDDVVVVGYQTIRKEAKTGSIATVDGDELASIPETSVDKMLSGKMAGVSVSSSNGQPGSVATIRVRGTSSIGAGNDPLYVVDGIPVESGDVGGLSNSMNAIALINASDIASVTVLKDAAAASIYGSRAAFGVILVTTKSGKAGKVKVNYSGDIRFSTATQVPKMANSLQFATYFNTANINAGGSNIFSDETMANIKKYMNGEFTDPSQPEYWGTTANVENGKWNNYGSAFANTDWFEEFYKKNVPSTQHNLSLSGGTEKFNWSVSGSFLLQNGLISHGHDELDRYTLNSKIGAELASWARLDYSTKWTHKDYEKPQYLTGLFFHNIARRWPSCPVVDPNGNWMAEMEIYELEDGGVYKENNDEFTQQLKFTFTPLKGWNIYAEGALRLTNNKTTQNKIPIYNYNVANEPMLRDSGYGTVTYVYDNRYKQNYYAVNVYTDYSHSFGKHNGKVLLGLNYERYNQDNMWASGTDLTTEDKPFLSQTQSNKKNGDGYWNRATAGYFGRFNYDYDGKYLAEFNIRYDGSSRFLADKRWAWFPSVSLGWNIAREEFFEKLSETVNTLKLRGSWGQLGNTSSNYNSFWDWYPFYQQQAISSASSNWLINGEKQNTSSLPSIVNATMTWETVETWDFGFDFGAFNNRLTGTFDWYSRTTKDMIGPAPILGSVLGTNAPKTNNCDMRTSGWELEIGWRDQINDFKYGVRFNLSDNRSKILTYPYDGEFSNQSIGGYYNGKYLNEIWGYESVGLASSKVEMDNWLTTNKPNWGSNWGAGDVMYKDLNGDGIVSSGANTLDDHGDLKRIGNATPRYRIGLNLDAAYKGFDFSIFFQGVLKRDWFFGAGDAYFWGAQGNMWQSACFEDHLDYWTENNTGAYYPKPYFGGIQKNQQTQTRYLQSAAYLRCKNIQLGYTLPKSLLSPAGISNCRIYLSCDNLFTITSLSDIFDPEAFGGYGDEGWGSGKTYPLQRTVSVGVNLSF